MLEWFIVILLGFLLSIIFDFFHFNYLKDIKKDIDMDNVEYNIHWVNDYYNNKY